MKRMITTAAVALTLAAPAFAQTSAEELFAMSNDSAAERIVEETSMGDVEAAEIKFALSSMSAAERKVFFESDESTRLEVLMAKRRLDAGNSAAEAASN